MKADPLLAKQIQVLVDDFKEYAATDPGEQQLSLEQRILEAKIHDLQQEADQSPKEKAGIMFDRVVSGRNLEKKLKDRATPLEFLYDTFNNAEVAMEYRLKAASSALAYVHRKLPAQVEHKVESSKKVEHSMQIEFVEPKVIAIEGDVVIVEDGEWKDG